MISGEEKEKYYDEVVAPILLDVMKKCQEKEIPFLAVAYYSEEGQGETTYTPADCNQARIRVAQFGIRCKGNVDALLPAIQRHAEKHGHTSAFLTILENAMR